MTRIYAILLLFFLTVSIVNGQPPIYQQEAFNRISLTEAEGGGAYDVFPLSFPEGRKPRELPKNGDITIRFIEFPGEEFQISWSAIASVETFNELVFQELLEKQPETLKRIAEFPQATSDSAKDDPNDPLRKSIEELYGYYDYLAQSHNPPPGIAEPYRRFLLGEAVFHSKRRDWPNAIARLEQLYTEQKNYPGLQENWGRIFNDILKDATEKENFKMARDYFRLFQSRFPNHPIAKRWTDAYRNRAQKLLDESKQAYQAKNNLLAYLKIQEAIAIFPQLNGMREHAVTLHETYPGITIGVSETMPGDSLHLEPFALVNRHSPLATMRQQRLLFRNFVEQVGFEVEGGMYRSPFGMIARDNYGQRLRLTLDTNRSHGAVELAESLVRLSESENNPSYELWTNEIASVEIEEFNQLAIHLTRRHVLPESLFRVPIFRSASDSTASTGPFFRQTDDAKTEQAIFQYDERYDFLFGTGPKVIRERPLVDTTEGLKLLAENKIFAIDRVAPWEIANRPEIADEYIVGKYAIPTVHFLIPNRNRPLPASRTFRRALLYGLNRQGIVQQLNGTGKSNGVELISGVAPKGNSDVDPIGYGNDPLIAPRLYDPKLAVALTLMSLSHARDKNQLLEEEQPKMKRDIQLAEDMPEIVIAHPNNTAARTAVQIICRQWESIGIPVRLVPYDPSEPIGRGSRVDFWYVACPIAEPMFDVRAILSGNGLVGASSVYMDLALKKLERSEEWADIAKELRAIHRLSFEETTILPLWQWKDCFIVRKELRDVLGRESLPASSESVPFNELFHFYQNVENWKVPFIWQETQSLGW